MNQTNENYVGDLVVKLANAVSFKYKEDKTCPGVTVSRLKNGDYYCSIVRYDGPFAKEKVLVAKSRAEDLQSALVSVSQTFLNKCEEDKKKDPLEELSDVFSK